MKPPLIQQSEAQEPASLLRGSDYLPTSTILFAASADSSRELAHAYGLAHIAEGAAEQHRERLCQSLPERIALIECCFAYQAAELAEARRRLSEKASIGNPHAKGELTKIKARQREVQARKGQALAVLRREPELIMPDEITFLADTLVVPSSDPEDQKRYDANVETIAMQVVRAYEEALRAIVRDVSTAE